VRVAQPKQASPIVSQLDPPSFPSSSSSIPPGHRQLLGSTLSIARSLRAAYSRARIAAPCRQQAGGTEGGGGGSKAKGASGSKARQKKTTTATSTAFPAVPSQPKAIPQPAAQKATYQSASSPTLASPSNASQSQSQASYESVYTDEEEKLSEGVPEHIVKQIAKQVLLGLDYIHRCCGIIHTDLKPENVLIVIDDVEAVVKAELETTPAAVPTKLVGVPPSQGRGGTQTPRGEGIFITGSQPLPSPSGSFMGTSPVLDKLSFHMSKISDLDTASNTSNKNSPSQPSTRQNSNSTGTGTAPTSPVPNAESTMSMTQLAADAINHTASSEDIVSDAISRTKITTSPAGLKATNAIESNTPTPGGSGIVIAGPSLLSQQAPLHPLDTGHRPFGEADHPPTYDQSSQQDTRMASGPSSPMFSNTPGTEPLFRPAPEAGDPSTLPPNAPYDPASLEKITVKIADLGNASWVDLHFTNDIQTRQYRSPEAILGARWGPPVDVWSAACMFFELLTGDYLFDPAAGSRYNKDDDHIAQIVELMGPFPRQIAMSGKFSSEIFTRKAELRHISRLKYWPLMNVLSEKYLIPEEESESLRTFVEPMLALDPNKRGTAKDMLEHPWISGIVTQGELEVEDAQRRGQMGLRDNERDALKPAGGASEAAMEQ
ncbi:MAG: serine/threonine protein kinase, CMGC group, partial [Cyphobasidiales sp. Tagirdzhanova-0007]